MARQRSVRRWTPSVLLALALTYGFVVFPDKAILFPPGGPFPTVGTVCGELPFRGGIIETWTARTRPRQPENEPAALYLLRFYGNGDRADANPGLEISDWATRDAEICGVNFPGYGGSTGPARLASIGPAALTAYDALRAKAGTDRPIVVFGSSLGTTAALYVAAQRQEVAGAILQDPPPIRQMILRHYGWWNLWLIAGPLAAKVPSALDSVLNAHRVHVRGIFIQAGNDQTVPPPDQQLIVDAYGGEKRLIPLPGAHHCAALGDRLSDFQAAVDWMLAPVR